jgi:hypothetical protein
VPWASPDTGFTLLFEALLMSLVAAMPVNTVAAFAADLTAHGGDPNAVTEVCIDMSPGFINGIADSLPKAAVTFDKLHAVKIVNQAVDQESMTFCGVFTPQLPGRRCPRCRWQAPDTIIRRRGGTCHRAYVCGFAAAGVRRASSTAFADVWRSAC